jgi:hypothetical protein
MWWDINTKLEWESIDNKRLGGNKAAIGPHQPKASLVLPMFQIQ